MMEKFRRFDQAVMEMTGDELKEQFAGLKSDASIVRSIIYNERDFLSVNDNRSSRSFWYSTVKPTLDRLGKLTGEQTETGVKSWVDKLSSYLKEFVSQGAFTYKDLKIVDESRKRDNPSVRYAIPDLHVYGYQTSLAPYPNIILAVEKDTVYRIVEQLASLFGCSCISGSGQGSFSAMEDLLRGIGGDADIVVLTLTDFDPAGYMISDTFEDHIEYLKGRVGGYENVIIERLGITPDQLTPEEVGRNKYTPSQKPGTTEFDKWYEKTGGINGEPKGLELDALSRDRIKAIFTAGVKKYIDPEIYKKGVKESYLRSKALEYIAPSVETAIQLIIEAMSDLKSEEFDILDLAAEGCSSLPIHRLCDHGRDSEIKELVASCF
jgi:hypothetical protein